MSTLIAARYDIVIERGIWWPQRIITVYDDIPPPDGPGNVVDLTDWTPHSQARSPITGQVLFDFTPAIYGDPTNGQVEMPVISNTRTLELSLIKTGEWSLVLEDPNGDWLTAIVAGSFKVIDSVTRDEP